jgi:pimeloyl-ACP methyl ester carboxylesterase
MPVSAGLHYFLHEGGGPFQPPVVLIHGEGGDQLSWPSELRRLPGYRSFTLDLPGHGKSAGPGLQSVPDYARIVVDFLGAARLSRAVLVGHGMGGAIALTLACDFPETVAGIVLVAVGARLPVASSLLENAANPSTFPLALQAWQAALCGPNTPPRIKEAISRRLSVIRPTLLHGDLLACDGFDLSESLGSIRSPALVICGTEDKFTPLRYSEDLASAIPGAALQTIDGAGHLVAQEQPRRLAGLLTIFLGTVPYTPGG